MDYAHNRFHAKASIFQLDLSEPQAEHLLSELYFAVKPQWTHLGLPCGTCSRARDKPVAKALTANGAPSPRPLRSAEHLLGLPDLTPHEQHRVDSANRIYQTAEAVLFIIFSLGLLVSIENPERSWLWAVIALLVKRRGDDAYSRWYFSLQDVSFDSCMHGSAFQKSTRLKATDKLFESMALTCDNSHKHQPWRVRQQGKLWKFDTANEAAYPALMAQRMVQCVVNHLPRTLFDSTFKQFRFDLLQQSGKQHAHSQALIPEYERVEFLQVVPTDRPCKVLQSPWTTGDDIKGEDEREEGNDDNQVERVTQDEHTRFYKVGFYHDPFRHLDLALLLQHPTTALLVVPDVLRRNVFDLLTLGYAEISRRRVAEIQRMIKLKRDLEPQEQKLRSSMPPHVDAVTKGKSLSLFRKLLEETNFPDMKVCDFMENGVDLTGWEPESDLYQKKYKPPTLTAQQLNHQALWRRKAMMGRVGELDTSQASAVHEETAKEVEAGFLAGPFSESQITDMLETQEWSLSRRFALLQNEGKKIRIIDDFKESSVNAAFGSSSYLALQDTDFISGFLRFIAKVCANKAEVVVPLTDGSILRGPWHKTCKSFRLQGRCMDLSKAYKQVAISRASLMHGVLGYEDVDRRWKLYTTQSLPFGASASVFAFIKISRALWHIMAHKLSVLCCVFYDDFPVFEQDEACKMTTQVLDSFFNLVGWKHAVTGEKATEFSSDVVALGVQYSLDKLSEGSFVVQNKPGRVDRIRSIVSSFSELSAIPRGDAAALAGLLNFAGGFVMGHSLKPACRVLSECAAGRVLEGRDKDEFCSFTLKLLENLRPRTISVASVETPIVVYTDGAYEDGVATWGALVIDPVTGTRHVLGGTVPDVLVRHWLRTVGEQVICEVEAFAYLAIRWDYRRLFNQRLGIGFIDNEAARIGFIKRSSSSHAMFLILAAVSILDTQFPFADWIERVPSASNPADLPSRGKAKELCVAVQALHCTETQLPPYLLSFLMSERFDLELAETMLFEMV